MDERTGLSRMVGVLGGRAHTLDRLAFFFRSASGFGRLSLSLKKRQITRTRYSFYVHVLKSRSSALSIPVTLPFHRFVAK